MPSGKPAISRLGWRSGAALDDMSHGNTPLRQSEIRKREIASCRQELRLFLTCSWQTIPAGFFYIGGMPNVILIVDDDPALLEALPPIIRFRLSHVDSETAHSPEQALRLLSSKHYDAILSDIRLPGMDGLELLRHIRSLRPATPVVMMTAHGDDTVKQAALQAGAVGFLQKPFEREELIRQLQVALHKDNKLPILGQPDTSGN